MCCMSLYLGPIIMLTLCVTTHAFSDVVLLGRRVASIVVFFSKKQIFANKLKKELLKSCILFLEKK
jgi:hypothetical protein